MSYQATHDKAYSVLDEIKSSLTEKEQHNLLSKLAIDIDIRLMDLQYGVSDELLAVEKKFIPMRDEYEDD